MYHFRLQRTDGTPADPPTYRSSTLNWRQGDKIPLTAEATSSRYCLRPRLTTRSTLLGFGRTAPGAGFCHITRPRLKTAE